MSSVTRASAQNGSIVGGGPRRSGSGRQYMQRVAAIGIVLRHSRRSRVVTAAALVKRAVIFAIGATIR